MLQIDWALLINWLVSGLIGLVFGIIGGYVTYRLERKRDDIKWSREKEQLESNWKHDKEQMEIVWQQKLRELEIQFHRDEQVQLRQKLLNGAENPYAAIEQILNDKGRLLSRRKAEMIEQLVEKGLILNAPLPQMTEELLNMFQEFLVTNNQQNSTERLTSESESVERPNNEKKENNTGEP